MKDRGPSRSTATILRAPVFWLGLTLAAYSIATTDSVLLLVVAFALSALSAVAWWRLERRRASVLVALGSSRDDR
jgi:hypothetical protein